MGWFYVEIERLSSHELLNAVCFFKFVYVYDVLCMRGDFAFLGDMIGRWIAWLMLIQRFERWRNLSRAISDLPRTYEGTYHTLNESQQKPKPRRQLSTHKKKTVYGVFRAVWFYGEHVRATLCGIQFVF